MVLSSVALWASLAAVSHCLPSGTMPANQLLARDDSDPEDLSWIKNWASVGDSYSAGIGAGKKYGGWGDYFCSRYDQSFPAIINTDARLGDSNGRTFNYWPCSGAVTDGVIKQVNALKDGSQDLITISSGGNDAYLADILNECIFQWNSGADPLNSKCHEQLQKSQDLIYSSEFHEKLDTLINSAKKKLAPNGQIMYTGYGQFFGHDTPACDGVTWAYPYAYGKREYLTQVKRREMNDLVLNMNKVLSEAVTRAGDSVTFVDYDTYFVQSHGRFCEDGYKETSPNRYGLLYYEWDTDDNAEMTDGFTESSTESADSLGSIEPSLVMNGTFEAQIQDWIREAIAKNPDSAKDVANVQGTPPSIDSVQATEEQKLIGYSGGFLPDGYGKVFHPRPNGHALIAKLVLYHVSKNYAKRLNKGWSEEEISSGVCPAKGSSASSTPSDDPAPVSECDTNALSGIPYNVFSGSDSGSTDVYGKFCDAVGKDQTKELTWTTDASGNEKSKRRRVMKRTPPPNPKAYDSYSFNLNFKPSGDSSCRSSCADAFKSISNSPCGHQGGTQNGMTAKASIDVGCGTYSYEITGKDVPAAKEPEKPEEPKESEEPKKPEELALKEQYCFPAGNFGEHGPVDRVEQGQAAVKACREFEKAPIKKDDPSSFPNWNTTIEGVPYKYTATWESGCEMAETELELFKPIPDNKEAFCLNMMLGNFKNCNNGGIGGSINVGCVKFEFRGGDSDNISITIDG